jgi:proteic killer suppression protein
MIKSFRDKETKKIFSRQISNKLPQNIQPTARKKLVIIDAAPDLNDLRIPPGNRLEALKGNRKGQHSIRINEIVHGKRSITADTALRLGRFFGMSPQFWLNLQTRYDLEVTEDFLADRLDNEVHALQAQTG